MKPSQKKGHADSLAKKLVRLRVFETAMHVVGEEQFLKGKHLGLASEYAGDYGVLKGLGVEGYCVLAEIDAEARNAAMFRWRSAPNIRLADIVDVAKETGKFIHINFDTCSMLSDQMLTKACILSADHLEDKGLITAWFVSGREPRVTMDAVKTMEEILKKQLTQSVRDKLKKDFPMEVLDDRLAHIARAFVLEQELNTYVHQKTKRNMRLVRIWTYVSTDYENGKTGTPMTVVQLQNTTKKFPGFEQTLIPAIRHDHFILIGDLKKRFNQKVVELLKEDRDAGMLLNSPLSNAAWKAHMTRGSYGK